MVSLLIILSGCGPEFLVPCGKQCAAAYDAHARILPASLGTSAADRLLDALASGPSWAQNSQAHDGEEQDQATEIQANTLQPTSGRGCGLEVFFDDVLDVGVAAAAAGARAG
jgi:hypothetical protein